MPGLSAASMAPPLERRALPAWQLSGSVLLQAAGSVAALLSTWWVTKVFGIVAQGQFGLLKGWSDAIVTLLMIGLPQALLHLSYGHTTALPVLIRFAWRFSLGCALLGGLLAAGVAWWSPWPWLMPALLAAPAFVLHGLLRAVFLRPAGPWLYAWVSVLPAMLLLAGLVLLAPWSPQPWSLALVASAVLSALLTLVLLARLGLPWRGTAGPVSAELWHTNGHALVQNGVAALQVPLLLTLFKGVGASSVAIGEVSLALLFVQVFAALANVTAPLVYDRVARLVPTPNAGVATSRPLALMAAAMAVLVLGVCWLMPELLRLLLPAGHAPDTALTLAARAMVLAGVALLGNRVAATVLQARGRFAELTRQSLWRLGATAGLSLLLWPAAPSAAVSAALALLVTELLMAARNGAVLRASAGALAQKGG